MLVSMLFVAAAAVPVEVGEFNPKSFPDAKVVERRMPQAEMVRRVDKILARGACTLPGQSKDQYDIVVPYAVQMEPNGAATKIVVKSIGCAPIEVLVGQVANELLKEGDLKPSHTSGEQWYVSEVYFAHGGQTLASKTDDDNRIICEAPRPRLGTRLVQTKVCRTAAEWRIYQSDRDQMQRDLVMKGQKANE